MNLASWESAHAKTKKRSFSTTSLKILQSTSKTNIHGSSKEYHVWVLQKATVPAIPDTPRLVMW